MSLLRFLGIRGGAAKGPAEPESLNEIGEKLESLPPEQARFVAAFAYLLARIAGADLSVEASEKDAMAMRLESFAGLPAELAGLLAETAIGAASTHGASDDHLVARAFRDMSGDDERLQLLRCLYAVAAADDTISTLEDNEIFEVATSIGVGRKEVVALRSEFRQYLGAMKALPRER